MTQEHPTEEPQGEQVENGKEQEEPRYYYSTNSVWMGTGLGMRRTHHKGETCRIGNRIRPQNRIEGRREETVPCRLCCGDETVEAQGEAQDEGVETQG